MKFAISLLLTANVMASPIKIFYEQAPQRAQWVRDIFTKTYNVPEELIELRMIAKCEELNVRGKLDLCLKNNGDLLVVSVDHGFVTESLKIFYAP